MIAIIIGTRAELIKTFPVMLELEKRDIEYTFIHTGQHDLGDLVKTFGVKEPDVVLTPPPRGKTTKFWGRVSKAIAWNLEIVPRIRNEIKRRQDLKFVLYHGDTMSTAAASVASSELLNPGKSFKNVHLEAGLRSGSIFEPFPEEISRKIADRFSDILFAVSDLSAQNLKREKQKGEIIPVGNTIIDSANYASLLAEKMRINAPSGEYALATVHRHENIKSRERLKNIIEILKRVPIKIYFMRYDNTERQLKKFDLLDSLKSIKNLEITEIKSYVEFIQWLKNAKILFTDGGSVQEESLVFKVPCIILRKRTERQEGLKTGLNFLSEFDVERTVKKVEEYLSDEFVIPEFKNPYGEVGVSQRIVEYLMNGAHFEEN